MHRAVAIARHWESGRRRCASWGAKVITVIKEGAVRPDSRATLRLGGWCASGVSCSRSLDGAMLCVFEPCPFLFFAQVPQSRLELLQW